MRRYYGEIVYYKMSCINYGFLYVYTHSVLFGCPLLTKKTSYKIDNKKELREYLIRFLY